ncbi:MAG TPA: MerR family transcriptional regulator [Burkholderiales bacterium]|nr:MerR family transcriptional regulator [Burkholderiales bacterium]
MPQMTIGRLARAAGVHVETIRYYQRLGLLDSPARPPGGVRRYAPRAVAKLRFIRRAQELGFSLAEIRRLIRFEEVRSCGDTRALAAENLARVEARLADLRRLRGALRRLIACCDRRGDHVACPIIEGLTR